MGTVKRGRAGGLEGSEGLAYSLMGVAGDATWDFGGVLACFATGGMFESMALLGSVTAKDQAMSLVWAAAQGHVHV